MPRSAETGHDRCIVHGYGDAARRMQRAGLDGVEIVASHGYLPAQFLNPAPICERMGTAAISTAVCRFLREVIVDIRAKVTGGFVVGLRISGSEVGRAGPDGG